MKTRNVIGAFRPVFCHSLTVVNFKSNCWFSSHLVVVSLAWVHQSISRLIGAGICWLRFSGVCSKLLSQLSKVSHWQTRNACRTDPVVFGNATLSLPANNLSRPHGGGNVMNQNMEEKVVSIRKCCTLLFFEIFDEFTLLNFRFPVGYVENIFIYSLTIFLKG